MKLSTVVCCSVLAAIATAAPSEIAAKTSSINGWNTDNYPDPRTDFAQCGASSPDVICDPDGLLTNQNRIAVKEQIADLEQQSRKVINKTPLCANGTPDGLHFFVILMNKIDAKGVLVGVPETKQFAYEIKAKYNLADDTKECDLSIVIVCSIKDRQLYMVAGEQTLLSGDTLNQIFNHNRFHFTAGNVFGGLTDLISELATDYSLAQGGDQLTTASNLSTEAAVMSSAAVSVSTPGTPSNSSTSDNEPDYLDVVKNEKPNTPSTDPFAASSASS